MSATLLDLPVAILAGGLGTRLGPLTSSLPKVLVPVAGQPFLTHQLALLRRQGIRQVVLCLGHFSDRIVAEYGDGRTHGVTLEYSLDGPMLLGTGGAVKRALPKLGPYFAVLYGDSYLLVEFVDVIQAFLASGKLGLMTVYRNEGRYDSSNILLRDGQIVVYDKTVRLPAMRHIDYGLSLFRKEAFDPWLEKTPFDLADVLRRLVEEKQLASFEVAQRFYEIGSPQGLAELDTLLHAGQAKPAQERD